MRMTRSGAGQRPAWVDAELFPFESRFADVGGHAVDYVDEGSGPPLLLLHGNPTWSFLYREVIERLRGSFRCIALDYPGLGLSTAAPGYGYRPEDHADVVQAFVEQLDLSGLTLVVHDWGGPIGLAVAQRSPQRFDRLVLTNTWAWPINGDLHFEGFARSMGGPLGRELIRRVNLLVSVIVPVGHRRRRVTAAEMAHYRRAVSDRERRNASAVMVSAILGSRAFLADVERGLPALADRPALLLWGDRDIAFRDRERRRWEASLPRVTTVPMPGAGHYVPSDAAADVADAIRSWHPGG
jgi:haloalkane dehalogenase